jgi:dihydroorotase
VSGTRCDLLLKDVRDPTGRIVDIAIKDGIVKHAGAPIPSSFEIDCGRYIVLPGAVDMHTHMRGGVQNAKEDWKTGSMSAIAGGVTFVVDQPNTIPPLTTTGAFEARIREATGQSYCNFSVNAGVSPEADPAALWKAGAMAFGEVFAAPSSYGEALSEDCLVRSFRTIGKLGGLATIHAEKVTEGLPQTLMEHSALRSPGGEVQAVRYVKSYGLQECRLHFCHLSTEESLNAAAGATTEVTPHHLFLSYDGQNPENSFLKVNPPVRSEKERKSLYSAWDRIDVIASDHAPHTIGEKSLPFPDAPSGIPGVETMVPLLMGDVVKKRLSRSSVIEKTSYAASGILGIPVAGFRPGMRADFACYRNMTVRIHADDLHSKAGWTPFEGMDAVFPEIVIMNGRIVYRGGEFERITPVWFPGRGYIGQEGKEYGAAHAHP